MWPREQQAQAAEASHALTKPVRPRQRCCPVSRTMCGQRADLASHYFNSQMAREGSLPPEHVTDLVLVCQSVSSKQKRGPRLLVQLNPSLPLYLSPIYHIPNRWLPRLFLSPSGGQEAHCLMKQLILFGGSFSYTEPNPFL